MPFEFLETIELFGNPLIDFRGVGELVLRFFINVTVMYIIVHLIFYPLYRQKNYLFSYSLINISVFLVCILLNSLKLKIGFAFGLFAVFAIIRYRTVPIPIKEMTYLFLIIIVAVINALSVRKISYAEVLLSNFIIVLAVFILEKSWLKKRDLVKRIRYEKIELIKPDKRDELIKDLKERTGLNVHHVDIERINFLNDSARLMVYYREESDKKIKSA